MNLNDEEGRIATKNDIVIRKYGLLAPDGWLEDCESEMRLMDLFWNKLVDIHEDYVSRYLLRISEDQEFATAKIELDHLISSKAPSPAVASSKRQLAIAQQSATRRMAVELRVLEASRREEVKIARQNSGLWWSNYNAIVRSFERARSTAIRGGNTMRRRSGDDNGRITNTLQGGANVEAIYDGSLSQVMVRPPSPRAWSAESRGERRRLQRTTLSATVFVRDGERRTVIWPMIMHRPIPPDCRVKELIITRRRRNGRWLWAASFICTRPAVTPSPALVNTKRIGVDIGWRRVSEGLRVATVLASGDEPHFVILPEDLLKSFSLIDQLQERVRASTLEGLDLIQNADAQAYAQPFQGLLREYQCIPEKRAMHLRKFSESSFFLEQEMGLIDKNIIAWRKNFKLLTNWLANQQRKVIARRNHFYRSKMINVLEGASEVVVNDVKFGEIAARKHSLTGEAFFPNRVNYYRNIAAPSELIGALKLQAAKRGIGIVKREAEVPVRCPECGSASRRTRADALPQICANCETSFDQDVATCESLLASVRSIRPVARTAGAGDT
jgi:hypothetical protein